MQRLPAAIPRPADNTPGPANCATMGLQDYTVLKGVPLLDGTRIDRIRRKRAP